MKNLFFELIFAGILLCIDLLHCDIRLSLEPGAAFFNDGAGYDAGLEGRIDADSILKVLPDGLFFGLDIDYVNAVYSPSNFTHWNAGGAIEAGYSFTILKDFITLSPLVRAGYGYSIIANSWSNMGSWGFIGGPAASLDISITRDLSLGLEAYYSFVVNGIFNANSLNTTLSLGYAFSTEETNQSAENRGTLEKNLRETIKEDKIQATVEEESSNEIKLSISDVLFELNSDIVSPSYIGAIKSIVSMATNYSGLTISIEGYTDDLGDEAYNVELSTGRAKNVARIFIDNGMPPESISYRGLGKENPVVPNNSEENRKKNRRVEIRFIQNP